MDDFSRLKVLTSQMHLEAAEDVYCPPLSPRKHDSLTVSSAVLPNGGRIKLLKTLLSSVCERNCYYCPFRSNRDYRRVSFPPEDFAALFMAMHRSGMVEGIFLSSGISSGGMQTQDRLLKTAEILRQKHAYQGYLHLKIMPGAEKDQVKQAMLLADRVSINLESPNQERLRSLAPLKNFSKELLAPLRWMEEIRQENSPQKAWKGTWPSSTTQFVVGGAGESDLEILDITAKLHNQAGLSRAYFSSFNPIPGTPLENQSPTPPLRERRLYQASYLILDYGFSLEELPFVGRGDLPLNEDPKLAWAKNNLKHEPAEINTAPREILLRVPGLGPKSVHTILKTRRHSTINHLSQLKALGISTHRLKPFILLNGKAPARQMALF
jgi:predicted DNA-binding helix-hairpin-helix protein